MGAPDRRRAESTKAAGAGGRPRPRKAERKQQILAHARQFFLSQGYAITTIEQIAEACGVSASAVLGHFDSKKALFLEFLREIRATTLHRWQSETADHADPLARLHAIADRLLDGSSEQSLELRVIHRALVESKDEEIAAALREFYLEWEAFLARIISDGQQTGVFRRSLDPRVGAWELLRAALGQALTSHLGIPLYAEPDYPHQAVDCLLHCLLKTDV